MEGDPFLMYTKNWHIIKWHPLLCISIV